MMGFIHQAAMLDAAIAMTRDLIEQAAQAKRKADRPTLHLRSDWMRADGFLEFSGMTPEQAVHLVRVLTLAVPQTLSGRTP